ncbi:MAG: TonB-dependent receptor [Bacteroides sp.]|nr:TonB-dependent receptor [Bacteroides sp.]
MTRRLFWCGLLFLLSANLHAQSTTQISGQVVDERTQEPLIGVSVLEKGTTNGVISDMDGNYSLQVHPQATIIFSYVGYVTQELKVSQAQGNIVLKEDAQTLQEIVIVGYGTQKKVNLTGAVAQVDGDKLAARTSANLLGSLQGELPGVTITRSSGKPGDEGYSLNVRGKTSVNNTSTLVLIDRIEGDMTLLNPSDIETVTVLKDAAAASIYGAKAAAGVVLVTTKKGQEGKVRINYNGYYAISTPGNMPKRLNSWEEQIINDIARLNASGNAEYTEEQVEWLKNPNFNYRPNISGQDRWDYYDNVNYIKEGTNRTSSMQSHSVSISGGSRQLNYLASAGYYKRNGILRYGPDGNERYNLRFNLNSEVNKYVSLSFNASYNGSFVEENSAGTGLILDKLYRIRTRQPIYTPDEDTTSNPYNGDLQVNPIDMMKNAGITKKDYEAFNGKGEIIIKDLVPGLVINASVARKQDYYSYYSEKRTIKWYGRTEDTVRDQINASNSLTKTKNGAYHNTYEARATYEFSLANAHNFKVLAGTQFEEYRKDEMSATVNGLLKNDFFSLNYPGGENPYTASDKVETWAMMSYFGRLNYNFKERYLFEANIRYDGSSRLDPDHRWKAFPSFSAGWRISEEPFFKEKVDLFDNLKLRASWGQLGNGAVLDFYDYIALISKGNQLAFNDELNNYFWQDKLASKSKTWETIETFDIGLDLGLLNNRLNITADYFVKRNKDMLSTLPQPHILGIGTSASNIGELKTWGWEIDIKWRDRIGQVDYWAGFSLADDQNKLVKYQGENTIREGVVSTLEGYALNTIWGYKTDGYFTSREEYEAYGVEQFNHAKVQAGDIKYLDLDGSGKIDAGEGTPENPGDLVYLGTTDPRYSYGISLGAAWKGFDLSLFFQGMGKRSFLIKTETLAPMLNTYNLPWSIHQDYWTEDNPNAFWPRLYQSNDYNYKASDKWVQNARYVRLKNIQLGYNVPIHKKIIEKLRVYVSGDDVWEHSKVLKVFDPESPNDASSQMYPFFRTVTFGVNLTF